MAMPAEEYDTDSEDEFGYSATENFQSTQQPVESPKEPPKKITPQPIPVSKIPSSRIPAPSSQGVNVEDFRIAVVRGNITLTKNYIEKGVDVNVRFKTGWTALMYAAHYSNVTLVSLLLDNSASTQSDPGSTTSLMAACLSNSHRQTEIYTCVKLLLDSGANINATDHNDMTSLMFACKKGHHSVVKYLLEHGAQANHREKQGWTALCYACEKGCLNSVQILINSGADLTVLTVRGQSVLDLSSQHTSVYDYLSSLPEFKMTNGDPEPAVNPIASEPTLLTTGFTSSASDLTQHSSSTVHLHTNGDYRPAEIRTQDQPPAQLTHVVTEFGDLELFFYGLELSTLIPKFHEHNITFQHLLDITDEELIKIGVHSVGWRKKILDSILNVHKKEWSKTSIPAYDKVENRKGLSCSELMSISANLSKHTGYINSTIKFICSEINRNPALVQHDRSGGSVHILRKFLNEMEKNCVTLSQTSQQLTTQVAQVVEAERGFNRDKISRQCTEKSATRRVFYILGGIATITVVALVTTSKLTLPSILNKIHFKIPFTA